MIEKLLPHPAVDAVRDVASVAISEGAPCQPIVVMSGAKYAD